MFRRCLPLKKHPSLFARHFRGLNGEWVNPELPPVVTLRPEYLAALRQPAIDLSNSASPTVLGFELRFPSFSASSGAGRKPFPDHSKGFLYYQPGSTELGGQLRLRICEDVSSFDAGRDLIVNNRPWGFDLVNIMRNPRCEPLVDVLVQDGFVSRPTVARLRTLLANTGVRPWRNVLCALSDPFYIQLEYSTQDLTIVSEQHIVGYPLKGAFNTQSSYGHNAKPVILPFTGTLKARFELSKLPEHASLGPTLVLKILETHYVLRVRKDVTIVKEPVAGEYHYRIVYAKMSMWRLCVDESEDSREAFGPLLDKPGIVYAE